MKILGLTGSIGMGKSTAAAMLARLGLPVHDADAVVHGVMRKGGAAVPAIEALFPDVVHDGYVDRIALGARVFGNNGALRHLEAILHPLVRRAERQFLQRAAAERRPFVVLDIPLLFETKGQTRCDAVIVLTAPRFLQAQRVLRRPGMTREKWEAIRARQTPDAEKRRRADFCISSGLGRRSTLRALLAVFATLSRRSLRVEQVHHVRIDSARNRP